MPLWPAENLKLQHFALIGDAPSAVPTFIFTINTANTSYNSSGADQFRLPLVSSGNYDFNVDWGDGSDDDITAYNDAATTHTYASSGEYTVTITGTVKGWRFNNTGDRLKFLNVSSWGPLVLSTDSAFSGCANLTSTQALPASLLDSALTALTSTFMDAYAFNQDVSALNVSNATIMASMLRYNTAFDQDISAWNVAKVTNMYNFMIGVTLSTANYDALLIKWATLDLASGVSANFGNSKYTSGGAAEAARTAIIADYNWTIIDGGAA